MTPTPDRLPILARLAIVAFALCVVLLICLLSLTLNGAFQ